MTRGLFAVGTAVAVFACALTGVASAAGAPVKHVRAAKVSKRDVTRPQRPGSFRATRVTAKSVTLTWSAARDNASSVTYGLYRDGRLLQKRNGLLATVDGLSCGQSYLFALDAVDRAANRSGRARLVVNMRPCPPQAPPGPPANLAVSRSTATSISLAWSPSVDGAGRRAVGYTIYRDGRLATVSADTVATIGGLTCAMQYVFEVEAIALNLTHSPRSRLSAATAACPPSGGGGGGGDEGHEPPPPPSAPANLAVSGATQTSVTLTWSASTRAVGYTIYRDGRLADVSVDATETVNGLVCGTQYVFEVEAVALDLSRSTRSRVTGSTAACPPPPPPAADLFVSPSGASGTWSFLSATYDGSMLRLYVNGAQVSETPVSGGIDNGPGPLTIGGNQLYNKEFFNGLIDEVRVYNRALTSAAIATDMGRPVTSAPGLVAAYSFDDGTAHDVSGQGNNGMIVGATPVTNGRFGGALSFTRTDDASHWQYVTVPDSESLELTTGMTLEAWVQAPSWVSGSDDWRNVILKRAYGTVPFDGTASYSLYGNTGMEPGGAVANEPSARMTVGGSERVSEGGGTLPMRVPCTATEPCQTLDQAYHVAAPGQIVEVAGGTYPPQAILADTGKTSTNDVVFRPAAGATVVSQGLDVYGSHITIRDLHFEGNWETWGTDDVTFLNDVVHGAIFAVDSSSVSVIGGSVGGTVDNKSQIGATLGGGNENILIDGVLFHDVTRSPDEHLECLLVGGVDGLIIRNSRFEHCDVFDLSIGAMNGVPSTNVVVENNFFATATDGGFYTLFFNDQPTFEHILVRNNSATQEMYFSYGTPLDAMNDVRVVGNVAPYRQFDCDTRIAYSHNVWQGATCGVTDKNVTDLGFVDASSVDLHLIAGSPAIDSGDPADFPANDLDGDARPQGALPDAGADEKAVNLAQTGHA